MRILLVEDHDELRQEIAEYLRRRQQVVTECGSLMQARAAVASVSPSDPLQAVVCDANLPDGNGIDFCVEASPQLPDCRWVLMSGAHDLQQVETKLSALPSQSGIAVVEKPISMRQLNQLLGDGT
jgi:DNA-binding response OmpR family regulator